MKRDWGRTIKIKTIFISLIAVFVIEAALKMGLSLVPANSMLLLGLGRLLQTSALVVVVMTLEGGLSAIGLERQSLYTGIKRGFLWSIGFGIVVLAVLGLLSMTGVDTLSLIRTRLPAGLDNILLYFLVGGILAPMAEEIFFRGILYGFLRRWGFIIALVLSTGLFLLAHPIRGGIPMTQLLGGILFAVAYEVEGSLMVPIIIHCLGNLSIFIISLSTYIS